jgi:hypothetical protein
MVCTVATPVGGISSFGKEQHKGKPDNLSLLSKNLQIFIYNNGLNLRLFGSSWRGQSCPFIISLTTKSGTNLRGIAGTCWVKMKFRNVERFVKDYKVTNARKRKYLSAKIIYHISRIKLNADPQAESQTHGQKKNLGRGKWKKNCCFN